MSNPRGRPKGFPSWKTFIPVGEEPPPVPISAEIPTNIIPTPKTNAEWVKARAERRENGTLAISEKALTSQEIRKRIQGLMRKHNYDPLEELMLIATDDTYPLETRISIHKEMANYVAPKLKSTDIVVEQSMDITVKLISFADTGQTQAPNRESIPVIVKEIQQEKQA